jgi:hypothetical protein
MFIQSLALVVSKLLDCVEPGQSQDPHPWVAIPIIEGSKAGTFSWC